MANEFLFEGRADLGQVSQEVNREIEKIESRIQAAISGSRAQVGDPNRLAPGKFGTEMGRIIDRLSEMQRQFVRSGQASDLFFNKLKQQVREAAQGRFPFSESRTSPYQTAQRGLIGREKTEGVDFQAVEDEQARYLQQLRIRRQAMELSIAEERERLRLAGVQNVESIRLANLVTEEARQQAEINRLEQIRAAQIRLRTQQLLRSRETDFDSFTRQSGEARALERATAERISLEAERRSAQDRTELARVVGERRALEQRRLAAERRAEAEARPDLRQGRLEDEAIANNIREVDGIRRRALEQQGRVGDITRLTALQEEAGAKQVNELQESVAKQTAISAALEANRDLVEREVVERKRAQALRRTTEAESLAGVGGDEIRQLNAREIIAKQRQVALQEAAVRQAAESLSEEERAERFSTAVANIQAQEVEARQRKLITLLATLQSEIRAEDIGDRVEQLEAQIAAAKFRQKEAIEEATEREFRRARLPIPGQQGTVPLGPPLPANTTAFQRIYARLHERQMAGYGGPGGSAPTFRQFVGSRALNTIGYGIGGAALYGGFSFMGEILREAEELELQLNILQAQFSAVGAAEDFPQIRDNVLEVARATGIAADEVAQLTVQFAGVFRTAGRPDTEIINTATRIAGELAKIGNISVTEIYDDLIAGARAFSEVDTAESLLEIEERLSNIVIQARNVTGVNVKETLDFIGRSGPIAQAAGLELRELNAIGATLLQGSSVGGAALAEQFNRIITDFGAFSVELLKLIQDYPKLRAALGEDGVARVARGDATALIDLANAYQELDASVQQTIIRDVGGRREGPTLAALFENATTLREVLSEATGEGNTREEEFQKRLETLSETIDQLKVRFGELGLAIFEVGLADFFKDAASAAQVLVEGITLILNLFESLDGLTGGILADLLMMAALIKTMSVLGVGTLFSGLGSRIGRSVGAGATAATFSRFGVPAVQPSGPYTPITQRPPSPSGVRGFLGTSSLIAGLAPAAAAVAVTEAAGRFLDFRSDLADQANELKSVVARRFAEVTSRDALTELRDQIEDLPESSFRVKFETFLAGSGTPEDAASGELQQQIAEAYGRKQAEALLGLDDALLESLNDRLGGGLNADVIRSSLRGYLRSPDDRGRKFVSNLASAAGSVDDPTVAAIAEIERAYFERAANAAALAASLDELGDVRNVADLDQLLRGFAVGQVPFSEVTSALEDRISKYDEAIGLARRQGNFDAVLVLAEEQAKEQDRLLQVIRDNLDREQGIEGLLAELRGQTGPEFDAGQAMDRLNALADAGAPIEDLTTEASNVFAAYKEIALQRIRDAETEGEKLALLDQGISIPAEARQAIARVVSASPQSKQLFADIARNVDVSTNAVKSAVEQAIIDFDNAALEAMRLLLIAALELQKAALERRLRRPPENPRQADIADSIRGRIADTEQQIKDLEELTQFTIPERGVFSEEDRRSVLGSSDSEKETDPTALVKAQRDLQLALSGDDPVLAARIAIENARTDFQHAEDEAGRISAMAAEVRGQIQLQEAVDGLSDAWGEFFVAWSGDDPITAAQAAQAAAQRQIDRAKNETQRLEGAAAKIRADRAAANAIFDLYTAEQDLVLAVAERAGDTVKVAETQTQLLRERLAQADQLGLTQAERQQLVADIYRSETAQRDARLGEDRSLIQFQLEIGEITKGQAIAALQGMLAIPNLAEEQRRELILEIERMRGELGQNFQFNLPSTFALPTIYEARRLNQTGGFVGGGLGAYQDNRQISVEVAVTEPGASAEDIGAAVAQAIGEPNRNGTLPRRY